MTPLPRKVKNGRPRKLLPGNADPILRHALAVIDNSGATYAAVCRRAGVAENVIATMKHQRTTSIVTVDHLLRACGRKLIIVPLDETDE